MNEMQLKYGCNPNQKPSRVFMKDGSELDEYYKSNYPLDEESMEEEIGFKYVELDELLANSDIISLHCPLTPETNKIINVYI